MADNKELTHTNIQSRKYKLEYKAKNTKPSGIQETAITSCASSANENKINRQRWQYAVVKNNSVYAYSLCELRWQHTDGQQAIATAVVVAAADARKKVTDERRVRREEEEKKSRRSVSFIVASLFFNFRHGTISTKIVDIFVLSPCFSACVTNKTLLRQQTHTHVHFFPTQQWSFDVTTLPQRPYHAKTTTNGEGGGGICVVLPLSE